MKGVFLIGFVLLSFLSYSQTSVSGTVIDKANRQPVEYASVQLIRLPDSALLKGTVTDKKGRFSIEAPMGGSFLIRYSFVGSEKRETPSFATNGAKLNLGSLEIENAAKNLNEVVVTGRKTTLNTSIDRKSYNVDNDIMSKSGSAADILKNVPSVDVDIDGGVSLRGSGDVIILINGKPSPLMGKSRAEVLQQLPANSIERIEVITNPSARFRPDGTSGIINIVMKKNIRNGFNGTVTANAGNQDRYNGSVNLNYHPKNLNLFGSYSIRKDTRRRYSTINRNYLTPVSAIDSIYLQSGYSLTHPISHIANAGFDYTLNEHNSFGVSGGYYNRSQNRNDIAGNLGYKNGTALSSDYDRLRHDPEVEKQRNATAYFQHAFPREDHELRMEFNTSTSDEVEDNHYTNIYRVPAAKTTMDNTLIRQGDKQNQLTIDYSNPLTEDSKLEAGYDGLFNTVDLNFYGENFDPVQQKFIRDLQKTNRFIYKEAIHAVYATYQKSYKKFGYSVGLRGEGAIIKGELVTKDSFVNNNYLKVYPTLHLSYNLNDNNEVQLNYSKRVHRPEADEINPFSEYQDPRNLRAGNPKLLPEIIHSVEAGYKWSNKNYSFVPSLYYRYKQNGFTSIIVKLNDTTLLTTTQNLATDKSAGLELIFSAKPLSWFTASLSSNVFYNRIDASNLGYSQPKDIVSFTANLNSSFTLTKTTMWQISTNFRSARLTPQGKSYPSFVFNTGIRQDLLKNKLSITFTASDLFASQRQRTDLHTPYFDQTSINRRDGRILYLGASYRFGVVKKKKEEKLQFDNGQ